MESKFSLKDYLNYTISGLLWITLLAYGLVKTQIVSTYDLVSFLSFSSSGLIGVLIIFFGGYLIGNLMRFTDKWIRFLNKWLFGNPYQYAIGEDKQRAKREEKLGLIGKYFNDKYSLNSPTSKQIETKLHIKNLYQEKKEYKEAQYFLVESYLASKGIPNAKAERMKDLKNFYDSVSMPIFIFAVVAIVELFSSSICCIAKLAVLLFIVLLLCQFVNRYRFLFSNFVKETYRNFLFVDDSL